MGADVWSREANLMIADAGYPGALGIRKKVYSISIANISRNWKTVRWGFKSIYWYRRIISSRALLGEFNKLK